MYDSRIVSNATHFNLVVSNDTLILYFTVVSKSKSDMQIYTHVDVQKIFLHR